LLQRIAAANPAKIDVRLVEREKGEVKAILANWRNEIERVQLIMRLPQNARNA
jgi:hypothetical protein